MTAGAGVRRQWRLESDLAFLNHGGFGACPIPVLEHQAAWRDRLEAQPVRFRLVAALAGRVGQRTPRHATAE